MEISSGEVSMRSSLTIESATIRFDPQGLVHGLPIALTVLII